LSAVRGGATAIGDYSTRCVDLVTGSLVIDMLMPLGLSEERWTRWGPAGRGIGEEDWADFMASEIDVMHAAYGIGDRDVHKAKDEVLAYVAQLNALIAGRPDLFRRIDSVADMDAVFEAPQSGILIGNQNSEHFVTPDDVDFFHGLGQRVSQLTYNSRTGIGNGSTERVDGGISDFGAGIITRMNEVGMAVDVSHCGDQTTLDAFELSGPPVLITHSNCRALVPGHPRCKTDEAIRAMAESGGVFGVTGVRMFVKNSEPTSIEDYLNHFDHVRDLVGPEFLGVGSDIDLYGYDALPPEQNEQLRAGYKGSYGFREKIDIDGVDHPRRMFDLTEGLIRRGYSNDEIRGILGGNFRRVLGIIWEV
jgi:membrane dipeptidase